MTKKYRISAVYRVLFSFEVSKTRQESADADTIRQIGLCNKRIGFDVHHLGDGGYGRVPDPENLMALSICIRGKRHTYMKMSRSLNR